MVKQTEYKLTGALEKKSSIQITNKLSILKE